MSGTIEGLAEAVCTLIEDEDLRKKMGKKAVENIERYGVEQIMEQWVDLFKRLQFSKNDKR